MAESKAISKKLHNKIENLYRYSAKKDPKIIQMKLNQANYNLNLGQLKKILDGIPLRQMFKRQRPKQVYPFILNKPRELLQMDLLTMTEDFGFKYILCVVDAFSRYAWCFPLKSKTGIAHHLRKLFERNKPTAIGTDSGGEFVNQEMKSFLAESMVLHKIGWVRNSTSQAIVERFNLTLRRGLMYFRHWYRALQSVVADYNKTYHSTIKMSPIEAEENVELAHENIKKRALKLMKKYPANFSVGDQARIVIMHDKVLGKGQKKSTLQQFTEQIYTVTKVVERENGIYIYLEGIDKAFTQNQLMRIEPKYPTE